MGSLEGNHPRRRLERGSGRKEKGVLRTYWTMDDGSPVVEGSNAVCCLPAHNTTPFPSVLSAATYTSLPDRPANSGSDMHLDNLKSHRGDHHRPFSALQRLIITTLSSKLSHFDSALPPLSHRHNQPFHSITPFHSTAPSHIPYPHIRPSNPHPNRPTDQPDQPSNRVSKSGSDPPHAAPGPLACIPNPSCEWTAAYSVHVL
ncbi:uncharacterized protein B0H64DRAFT_397760 [Chaetomium fimeti]|uniref:Uncharacterized protein n=1 Tax=Chaetomium fimeti TaxID=1854472 RepID=A0AAE0HGQ0_9PEZI|nr:hypothetical protein B0H64DRAFT_397760 [Chaetomium fimeti]